MASTIDRRPNYGRRIRWLGVAVAVAVVLYSAGWFWLAARLEDEARTALAAANRNGVTADCTNAAAHGFPFRLGLFCDRVSFEDANEGIALSAGALRSAGQIYDPARIVAELDGPARIDMPQTPPLAVSWGTLRASVRLASPLPERLSIEGRDLTTADTTGRPLLSAATFEAHMRPNAGDLDLAASFTGLALAPSLVEGRDVAPLDGQSDLTVKDGVAAATGGLQTLRGRSGTIRTLTLSSGTAGLSLSGPFSVDAEGLLDADLRVAVRDPVALSKVLADAIPERRKEIESGFSGLAALGAAPTLPLRIARGRAVLGFIPLGDIPPLQ